MQPTNYVFVGGTAGIGLAAATELARRGAELLLVARDPALGERSAAALRQAGARSVDFLPADLATIAGMSAAVPRIRAWRPALSGLVHSAMSGVMQRSRTADGLDRPFALQFLARYALDRALLDHLAASGDGRIVHVGAAVPRRFVPDLDDLQFDRRPWRLMASLMSSQWLGHATVQELARRHRDLPITATVACVGPTHTKGVQQEAPWWARALYAVIATTPEKAARNLVHALTTADPRPLNGAAFLDPKRPIATPIACDETMATRAWNLAADLLADAGLQLP